MSRGRKRGFTIPVNRWLVGRWQQPLTELLETSLADQQGWINSRAVRNRLNVAAKEGRAPNQLWYIFVLESWLRHEQDFRTASSSLQHDSHCITPDAVYDESKLHRPGAT